MTPLVIARNSKGTTLYVRGRDIEEAEQAIMFNKATCRWTILGDAAEIRRSGERNKILEVLEAAQGSMSPSDIAKQTGMDHDNVRYLLGAMVKAGEVQLIARGEYGLDLGGTPHKPHKLTN